MTKVMNEWPPLMLTRTAVKYTQRARSTLARAVASGELPVAGHNGRSMVFRREDLDRWMLGGSANSTPAERAAPRSLSITNKRAIQRLRAIVRRR